MPTFSHVLNMNGKVAWGAEFAGGGWSSAITKATRPAKNTNKKMGEPSIQEIPPSDSKETAITAPEAVFEILFPAASHKQSIFTSDPDEILDGMKTSQASVKDGDPVPTV